MSEMDRIHILETKIEDLNKRIKHYSTYRLLSMGTALIVLPFALWYSSAPLFLLSLLAVMLFIVLLHRQRDLINQRDYNSACRKVLIDRQKRFTNEWQDFPDTGQDLLDPNGDKHSYHLALDCDVFGQGSIFQRINLTSTKQGRKRLAKALVNTNPKTQDILNQQEAIKELVQKDDYALHITTLMALGKEKASPTRERLAKHFIDQVDAYHERKNKSKTQRLRQVLSKYMPLLTVLSVLLVILFPELIFIQTVAITLSSLQLIWSFLKLSSTNKRLEGLEAFNDYILAYEQIFVAIESEVVASKHLKALQETLDTNNSDLASKALSKLKTLANFSATRQNTIAWFLLNMLFLWDEVCLRRYDKWAQANGSSIKIWLDTCSEYEALLSLAATSQCYSKSTWPTLTDSAKPQMFAKDLRHPLLPNEQAVANDAVLEHKNTIITGSNMSGKTTYLRSIGLSVLMAQAGAMVPSSDYSISNFTLHSSIRVDDNVNQGISGFYAEILRIKEMVLAHETNKPSMFLIDEIFRGTNSADRIAGSKAAIQKLSGEHVLLLVSTHDFELCDLEFDPDILAHNRHFSEHYIEDEIHFDYKIKNGRSESTNARFLLRLAGIET